MQESGTQSKEYLREKGVLNEEELIDIDKYLAMLRRRWVAGALALCAALGFTAFRTITTTPVYKADAQVLIKNAGSETALAGLESTVGELSSSSYYSNPINNEIAFIRSQKLAEQVVNAMKPTGIDLGLLSAATIAGSLSVAQVPESDLIQISFQDTSPTRAVAILDQVVNSYVEKNLASNRAEIAAARSFVEKQLPGVEANLRGLDKAIRNFEESNKLIDLPAESEQLVERYTTTTEAITEALSARAVTISRIAALQRQLGMNAQEALSVNAISQSAGVQGVLAEYQKVETALASARSQLNSEHPQIIALQDQLAQLKSLLSNRVGQTVGTITRQNPSPSSKNLQAGETQQTLSTELINTTIERLTLESKLQVLQQAQTQVKQRMDTIPQLKQSLGELQRRKQVAQTTYEALLKSLQSLRISENQSLGNVEIVQSAVLAGQVAPRVMSNLLFGLVAGVFLAHAIMMFLESRDKSLKTVQEVEEEFDMPPLTVIPRLEKDELLSQLPGIGKTRKLRTKPSLILRDDPKSIASHAFRLLQTNLSFLNADKAIRTIAITSSIPGEGKSTVSANLALAIAEMNYKVLLVDADLRLSMQHQIWELPNRKGLSNIIAERLNFDEVVQKESPNLHILTAGMLPPNPTLLLNSNRMGQLVEQFAQNYDYVIFDTPPINSAVDTLVLGKIVDGTLMIARPGIVDHPILKMSKRALHQSGQNLLGIVVNGVILENERRYYSNYYNYFYAHGYYMNDPGDQPALSANSINSIHQNSKSEDYNQNL